jgi:hypothetical protein
MRFQYDRLRTDASDPSTNLVPFLAAKGAESAKGRRNPLRALGVFAVNSSPSTDLVE